MKITNFHLKLKMTTTTAQQNSVVGFIDFNYNKCTQFE